MNLNAAVAVNPPRHAIQRQIGAVLRKLSLLFDELDEELGRPSIPPEPLAQCPRMEGAFQCPERAAFL